MCPIFRAQKATSVEEMKYALRVVKHYSSFNSCADLAEFLRDIVSDSLTVPNFTVGKTKCLYLIKFGIAMDKTKVDKPNSKKEKRNAALVVHWIVQIVCD